MDNSHQSYTQPNANTVEAIKTAFDRHMKQTVAHGFRNASQLDKYQALSYSVRDKMIEKWLQTQETYYQKNPKRIYYFSLEFLMGRTLGNAILNLDLQQTVAEAMHELGLSLEELERVEWDAGLGNGGLGRLAACFLDSMATDRKSTRLNSSHYS